MSVNRFLRELDGLFNYSTDENPTTQQEYQEAVKNWVDTIKSLVDAVLWQPETTYQVGDSVRTPSLPKYAALVCATGGQSGAVEPNYTDVSIGDSIADGTVVWIVADDSPLPAGCVQAFAGSTLPDGWLLCDGSAVSRTTYAALFAVIGTTYGAGDGSTTFNLPNLTDRFIQGNATAGTVKTAGLPNIVGSFNKQAVAHSGWNDATGCFHWTSGLTEAVGTGAEKASGYMDFNASRSSSIYGNSTTVQPPALTMRYIIKY